MHQECDHELSLINQLSKIQFQLMHQFLTSSDIYPGQFHLLNLLSMYEKGLHQKEISKKLYIKPSSVNQIIVKLEESKYIKRITDPKDKRMVIVTISSKGKKIIEKAREKSQQIHSLMVDGIESEELAHFEKIAKRMKENLLKRLQLNQNK